MRQVPKSPCVGRCADCDRRPARLNRQTRCPCNCQRHDHPLHQLNKTCPKDTRAHKFRKRLTQVHTHMLLIIAPEVPVPRLMKVNHERHDFNQDKPLLRRRRHSPATSNYCRHFGSNASQRSSTAQNSSSKLMAGLLLASLLLCLATFSYMLLGVLSHPKFPLNTLFIFDSFQCYISLTDRWKMLKSVSVAKVRFLSIKNT